MEVLKIIGEIILVIIFGLGISAPILLLECVLKGPKLLEIEMIFG